MNIHYRVQSCPGREQVRDRLLAGLPSSTEVIVDEGPDANPWRGFQKCIQPADGYTHLCVIQDDAVVCRNFSQAIESIVATYPDNLICLFVPGSAQTTVRLMTKALMSGQTYVCYAVPSSKFIPVVATVWPVAKATDLLEWSGEAHLPGHPRPAKSDDAVCGLWARTRKEMVIVTVPSLVQHPDDVESTIGRPAKSGADRGRIAAYHIGDGDPLDYDWSNPA